MSAARRERAAALPAAAGAEGSSGPSRRQLAAPARPSSAVPATTKVDFRTRVWWALQRRLRPDGPFTAKLLAQHLRALGVAVSHRTVESWCSGGRTPSGENLVELERLLGATFAAEIRAGGGAPVPPPARALSLAALIEQS